ncbi:multidrug effflux MFS transporter [Brevundimonas halotolerans]|uniref:Bcr/CflA family efflux transporter n=1 Tax=Brevundimonas halotolerans TaxID=69670 RepID=A0A7W9E6D3_9CAUL|nr:multidrug effflux MFS transporter [Brevundimonas halotolerans]MBB5660187.1 DHA1 family bicyclomycin/chloramphenicol resistance-like MFS transporter [Brevundimonas halotolerans]
MSLPKPERGPGFPEFVALIATMMALNALAIDMMLPALPAIGDALDVASENARQWVITAYLLGFGMAQLIYGPLADRYGRKPVLMAGLSLYVLFSVVAAFTTTFEALILARLGTGLGAAALRVLAVSIVRDRYSGRTMARVMSLSFLVFLGVPILAPTLGQLVLFVAPWRWIFGVLALAGSGFMIWALIRLPETLAAENRLPIRFGRIAEAFRAVVSDRLSVGYTLAMTAITGSLFAFINSSQQIFFDVFQQPTLFTTVFGLMAAGIAVASLTNARLVERLGSRRLSHLALIGFITSAAVHAGVTLTGHESLISFALLQGLTMFCFGFIAGNFGALAMNNMGRIAGTASSVQGFVSTTFGSLTGFLIGQSFDGTAAPMTIGITGCGVLALVAVLVAERGKLFSTVETESRPA